MPYEYRSSVGVVLVARAGRYWVCEFAGKRMGRWMTVTRAVDAVVNHRTGLADWDRRRAFVEAQIDRWTPLDDQL